MSDTDLCYKSCGDYIVIMKKLPDTICNESRKGIVDPPHAKFRANKRLVVSIEHTITGKKIKRIQNTSYEDKQIWYEESKKVSASDYNSDLNKVCTSGIHYFLSRDAAFYWKNAQTSDAGKLNGPYKTWYHNGQKCVEYTYVDGKLDGSHQRWYQNGQKLKEYAYVMGELDGPYKSWYHNGQKEMESAYVMGKSDGPYKAWYQNGQKEIEIAYVMGKLDGPYKTWYSDGQTQIESVSTLQEKLECTYGAGIRNRH